MSPELIPLLRCQLCPDHLSHLLLETDLALMEGFQTHHVQREIQLAVSKGLKVNVYLEDWSNGMAESPDYVFFLVDALKDAPVERIMLPDTLGSGAIMKNLT